jgi:hypothetical protein
MVLVKEDTMKPLTRTLGAIGATTVTAALVLGLAFSDNSAASSTTPTTPTSVSMPMNQMPDMGSMMTGDTNAMADMMGSTDMSDMHATMHQMMKGVVDDVVLEACDNAHATMAGATSTMQAPGQTQHDEHHGGAQS